MKFKTSIAIIIIILLGIGTVLPFLRPGFFDFHDNTVVVRVYEMAKSLNSGMFPVRWVEGLGYGYGYPIFNFYGPLPYYLGSIFYISGFGLLTSTKIMIVIGVLLSGVNMFFLSKKFFGVKAGIISSLMYLYYPYHAVNIYVRGAVGELFAYAFLPLVFLGLFGILNFKKNDRLLGNLSVTLPLIFGIAIVSLSHNLTIFMLLLILFTFLLISLFFTNNRIRFLTLSLICIIFGLMLSSFFIVPAFLEMGYTNVSSQVGGGATFSDHFVCFSQFWNSLWGYGGSIPGCVDGVSFMLGKINILIFIATISVLSYSIIKKEYKKLERITLLSIVMILISVLLTNSLSHNVWSNFKLMEYIQYPWRFINFIALFMCFSAGYLIYFANKKKNIYSIILVICLSFLILFASLKYFTPQSFNNFGDDYYKDSEYIKFTVSKISDEYLPKNFQKPPTIREVPGSKFSLLNDGMLTEVLENPKQYKLSYVSNIGNHLHANIAYFPAWNVYVNGVEADFVAKDNGILVSIPKGTGEVAFKFEQTPIEILGNLLSVLAFFVLLAGIIVTTKHGKEII